MATPKYSFASRMESFSGVNIALLQQGFRPFYLLAGIFAVIAISIWLGILFGYVSTGAYLNGVDWHSHEMIFGFAVCVISGFLLAAVQSWTGIATPSGYKLLGLVVLWVFGRVFVFFGPPIVAALVDLAFLPALTVTIAIPILRSQDQRNIKVVGILVAFTLTNLCFHLAQLGYIPAAMSRTAIVCALDLILLLIAVIAGRVIPNFTANLIPDARPTRSSLLEAISFASLLLVLLVDLTRPWLVLPPMVWASLLIVAGGAHAWRLCLWSPLKTRKHALLWMLPVSYAWLSIALIVRAVSAVGGIAESGAFHSLTLGAMASLMLAMMTRSARGHTGRALVAGPVEVTSFLLLQVAAFVRVFPSVVWPSSHWWFVGTATLCWTLAFTLFVVGYFRMLTQPSIPTSAS